MPTSLKWFRKYLYRPRKLTMPVPNRETGRRIKPPTFIELEGLNDLGRLACALERVALPIFSIKSAFGRMLSTQLDLFMGTPIFYAVKTEVHNHFLAYRNAGGHEEVVLVDSPLNPGFSYAPIIGVSKLPPIFEKGLVGKTPVRDRFLSMEVEDLSSLARVAAYKIIFEEPPLPLFLFTQENKWVLGTFTRIDEYEEASLFFYYALPSPPAERFLKYSTFKSQDPTFTNRIDEHGQVYIKIVKLAKGHPLVTF